MTMAGKRKQYGEEFETTPSRFLDELPIEDLTWEGKAGSGKSHEEKQALGKAHLANLKNLLD